MLLQGRMVPRGIPVLGLVGGAAVFASGAAVLLGVYDQLSPWGIVAALPVFAWEITLAVWLILKGVPPPPGRLAGPPAHGAPAR